MGSSDHEGFSTRAYTVIRYPLSVLALDVFPRVRALCDYQFHSHKELRLAKKMTKPANVEKQSALNAAAISHVVGMVQGFRFARELLHGRTNHLR